MGNRLGGARVILQVCRALQHGETDRFRQLAACRRAVRRTGDQKGFGGRRHRKARRAIGAFVTDRRRPCLASDEGAIQFLLRSEEHTSELQSLMRISYAVFCLKKKKITKK